MAFMVWGHAVGHVRWPSCVPPGPLARPLPGADIRRLHPVRFRFKAAEVERAWAVIAHCDGGLHFRR
jgi:hypothetical protein